jgi:hypothetical protein
MDDLVAFAQLHGLKIGTIRDLIAYRLKKDHLVEQTAEARFESRWGGTWTSQTFLNKALGTEQVALVKGGSSLTSRLWCACTRSTSFPTCSARRPIAPACCRARCGSSARKDRA